MPIEILLEHIAETRRWAAHAASEADRLESRLVKQYVEEHRKYPDGTGFYLRGYWVVIICAMGALSGHSITIAYGVSHNGRAFDSVLEKNVTPA